MNDSMPFHRMRPVVAASTGLSEALMSTVEADAKRTATEVAKRIREAYEARGWLP